MRITKVLVGRAAGILEILEEFLIIHMLRSGLCYMKRHLDANNMRADRIYDGIDPQGRTSRYAAVYFHKQCSWAFGKVAIRQAYEYF